VIVDLPLLQELGFVVPAVVDQLREAGNLVTRE